MFNTLNHTTALYETSYEVAPAFRKLKRTMRHSNMVSKIFLEDPDFANAEVDAAIESAMSSATSIVTTTKTLGTATKPYRDFTEAQLALDKQ